MRDVGFIRALIVLHRAYLDFPISARIHVLIRFLTSPFLRVLQYLPAGASVLDIGAGHGVFSVLAHEVGARPTAVDPDVRKVRRPAGVQAVVGYDSCIRGTFDAVAIIDVLYKIPFDGWDALLQSARERLESGGILIVKEHDPTARIKHFWNRIQERLATALHLTLGESFSYETPEAFTARLRRNGFNPLRTERIDTGYLHPHMLYVGRRE